jgi:O-antigen ligase
MSVVAALGIVLGGAVAFRSRRSDHPIDRRRLAAAALVATLIGGGLFVFGHGSRLLARRLDPGTEKRGEIIRQTLRAASSEPVFGIGAGNLLIVYRKQGQPIATGYAHNEYLQAFAETGAVGLIGVLSALVLFAAWAFRRRPGPRSPARERLVWAAAVAACAAFAAQSAVDLIWRFPVLVAMAFLWLAIASAPAFSGKGGDEP